MGDVGGEECGVVGITAPDAARKAFVGLRVLQHRGQESAGIASFDGLTTRHFKDMGLVSVVFTPERLAELKGDVAIAHVRYSTTGSSVLDNAQPVIVDTAVGKMALAHNGDIANASALRAERQERGGWAFFTTSDSEIIVRLIADEFGRGRDVVGAIRATMRILVGAYSLVIMVNDTVYAVRDPLAVRPLCYGRIKGGWAVASESVVLDFLEGGQFERDLRPGEILEIRGDEVVSHQGPSERHTGHCMFEWVYFARPDSLVDGQYVASVRHRIGRILAREHPADADIVIPVPDSGRTQAVGFADESEIRVGEGLMKNRFVERTFIMPEQKDRTESVALKLNPIPPVVEGKRVVLIDDSIVRGNTMRKLVETIRSAGATAVHVRVGCPKIIAPCPLGIDMKTRDQFIAVKGVRQEKSDAEIARELGADSVGYISIHGLVEALRMGHKELCLGCLTGVYPVKIEGERHRAQESLDRYFVAEPVLGDEVETPGPRHKAYPKAADGGSPPDEDAR
jgi:amidophosphoribosyltransferase